MTILFVACEVGYQIDIGIVNADVTESSDIIEFLIESTEDVSIADIGDKTDINIDKNLRSGVYSGSITLKSLDDGETLITSISIPVIFPEGRGESKPIYFYNIPFCIGALEYKKYILDEKGVAKIDIVLSKDCDSFRIYGLFEGDVISGDCEFFKGACFGLGDQYYGKVELRNTGEVEYHPQINFVKKYLHPFDIIHLLPNFPVDMATLKPQILIDGRPVKYRIEESEGIRIIPEEPLWFNRNLNVLLGDVRDILGKRFDNPSQFMNIIFYDYIKDLEFDTDLPKHSYGVDERGNSEIRVEGGYLKFKTNSVGLYTNKGYVSLFFGKRSGKIMKINMKFEPQSRIYNARWYVFSDKKIYGPYKFAFNEAFNEYFLQIDGEDNYYFLFEYDTFFDCSNDNLSNNFDYKLEIDYVRFV